MKALIQTSKKHIAEVQGMLFPLSPLVKKLEALLKLLPRKFLPVDLKPDSNIQMIDLKKGHYNAINEAPKFQLDFINSRFKSGWVYFEAVLVRHSGEKVAKIYFDIGAGFSEVDSVFIPSNFRGTIREVVFIPKSVKAISWQPSEVTGHFTQSHLIFHHISWLESFYRRAWRVLSDLWRHRKLTLDKREGIHWLNVFFGLNKAYTWTANLRRSKKTGVSYEAFIGHNDALSLSDTQAIINHVAQLPDTPMLSILMPVYNPRIDFFREVVESIIVQYYPYWELCLADDASTNSDVKLLINEYTKKDSRIKAVFRSENGHISAASNTALALASGIFVVLVDQDDLIPPHALYHVAVEINRHPEANIIYSDEDKIDEFGNRFDPYYKPDWNQDLFYSQNMISHIGVYRTSLVREIGGFRLGYEGAQDYDLALRCIKKTNTHNIRHIARVLYHWRAHANSTALSHSTKKYASLAGRKALEDHFNDSNVKVNITKASGMYRIIYSLPEHLPLVTLIIATRDKLEILKKCIESIKTKTSYKNFEVIVVDNQSTHSDTLTYLSSLSQDKRFSVVQYNAPFNFSAINNCAVTLAKGEIIGLINNDIEVINDDWLTEMVRHVMRPDVGAVGAKLLYADKTIQHAGVILGVGGLAGHAHKFYPNENWGYFCRANLQQELSAVTGACLFVKKSTYEIAGGLDEDNLTVAFNDVDFCLKLRSLGLKIIYTPYALLYHHESMSRGQEDSTEKRLRFFNEDAFMKKKWGATLLADPFYNPNLTKEADDFSLASHIVTSTHHGYPLKID